MAYIGSPAAPTIATVSDGTVTSAKLADDAVTSAKITDGAVTPSDLSTGHPNWDSSGNVGIGTSSPAGKFHAEGTNSGIVIDTSTAYTPVIKASGALSDLKLAAVGNGGLFLIDVNGAERMRIDSSGNVLVGTTGTSPLDSGRLRVYNNADQDAIKTYQATSGATCLWNRIDSTSSYFSVFRYQNTTVGTITTNGSSTSYNTSSDYRLKENVIEVTDGIDRVKLLKPSRFNFIADPDKTVDGFLAHEVQDVVPEAITGTKDAVDADGNPKYQGIDQSKLVPLLTAALQEAITKIETLEARVATLESA